MLLSQLQILLLDLSLILKLFFFVFNKFKTQKRESKNGNYSKRNSWRAPNTWEPDADFVQTLSLYSKKIFNFFSVLGCALLKLGHFYKYIRRNTAQKIKKKPDFNVNVFFTDIILLLFYRVDVKIPSVKIKMTLIVANPNTNKSVIID